MDHIDVQSHLTKIHSEYIIFYLLEDEINCIFYKNETWKTLQNNNKLVIREKLFFQS